MQLAMQGPRSFCFGAPPGAAEPPTVTPIDIRLPTLAAEALARLVPLLGCGEEAAALAFDGLAAREHDEAAALALATIGAEEQLHDALLKTLAAALPSPNDDHALRRAARRFHVQLGRGGSAAHLGRIAAIDAAVCTVLARLLRPGTPIARDVAASALFHRILRDEARHVRVSRTLAVARMAGAPLRDLAAGARGALANVLLLAGDAFDALGVDPDGVQRDVARVPNGLFAP